MFSSEKRNFFITICSQNIYFILNTGVMGEGKDTIKQRIFSKKQTSKTKQTDAPCQSSCGTL